jgi:hypothetical protein
MESIRKPWHKGRQFVPLTFFPFLLILIVKYFTGEVTFGYPMPLGVYGGYFGTGKRTAFAAYAVA